LALLAFCEIIFYRTPVRRRKQFHKISTSFFGICQRVDGFIDTLRAVLKQPSF